MKMQKPEMEFIEFNTNDVIATSGGMYKFPSKIEIPAPDVSPAKDYGWGGWFTNQDIYNQ